MTGKSLFKALRALFSGQPKRRKPGLLDDPLDLLIFAVLVLWLFQ